MPARARIGWLAGTLLLPLLTVAADTVDLTLDSLVQADGNRQLQFRIESRATFQFDADAQVLTSSGVFTAQNVVGPGQLSRLSHKIEDLRAAADGSLAVRSYECVEGTLGAFVGLSFCGNYRFGPNGVDDGGLADDEVLGQPRSLAGFQVRALSWDGQALQLTLGAGNHDGEDAAGQNELILKFSTLEGTGQRRDKRPAIPPD